MSEVNEANIALDDAPPTDDEKRSLNELIGRLGNGATILVQTSTKARRLTVERRVTTYDGTPEWTGLCINPDTENAVVCSGYGTTYLLYGYADAEHATWLPTLRWPSRRRGAPVWDLAVETRGTQLAAENTAADLLGKIR